MCVWDGMRPDFITPENTPVLHALGVRGTVFAANHSSYVTTTEVNGTVLATGMFPARSGIIGNREYRPEINLMKPFATEGAATVRLADALYEGRYIDALTVAELVQKAGFRTAVAGTKAIGLLHDRNWNRAEKNGSVVLFAGKTYPEKFADTLTAGLGKWPELPDTTDILNTLPNTAQNVWTTRAVTEFLWRDGVPKFSVLWLGDPDFSQHLTAPGSATALTAIHDCDTNLGLVLDALKAKGAADRTDVFVVSDHGFSTITRVVDVAAILKKAGIDAVREHRMTPAPGSVLVVNVGGTTGLYVTGREAGVIQKCVDVIEGGDFAGPIFTKDALPGTFALALAHLDSQFAPDVVFSFRWSAKANQWGTAGTMVGDAKRPGGGTHGTLGPTDIHNTLIAAGPDIRAGFKDTLPTGNIDVAPTILRLLGIAPPEARDGRVLAEALTFSPPPAAKPETKRIEAARPIGGATWRQYLQTTTLGGAVYFDEGNAETK